MLPLIFEPDERMPTLRSVIPAQAGIQGGMTTGNTPFCDDRLDSRLRGNDGI
jgi:hypothetical protein